MLVVIPLTRHAVEMDEVEAGFFGAVDEPLVLQTRAGACCTGRSLGVGRPIGPAACEQHERQKKKSPPSGWRAGLNKAIEHDRL
jgi:hypothetical protein